MTIRAGRQAEIRPFILTVFSSLGSTYRAVFTYVLINSIITSPHLTRPSEERRGGRALGPAFRDRSTWQPSAGVGWQLLLFTRQLDLFTQGLALAGMCTLADVPIWASPKAETETRPWVQEIYLGHGLKKQE